MCFSLEDMKIGIDLDGVAADWVTPFLEFHKERYGGSFSYDEITSHDFWDIFGITRDEAIHRAHEFYLETPFDIVLPVEGAVESIKALREVHELVVITARPFVYKQKTLDWLKEHFPDVFDKVVFTNQYSKSDSGVNTTKAAICEQEKIDLLIDDYDKYVWECAPVCGQVLLFDQPWNQGVELPGNAVRVKSWSEVMEVLK